MYSKTLLFLFIVTVLSSCQTDRDDYDVIVTQLDREISTLINKASQGEGASYFTLPESTDYSRIPQDPQNPITSEKVALGKLLLHETALGGKPKMGDRLFQYACATCHPVASGFSAGRRQGIGEGGAGFGLKGEGRFADISMPLDSLDVQPVKPPTLLNLSYQDVMLWDGRFGGVGVNIGTSDKWDDIPENFDGFHGIEVQAMQGQDEHRLKIDASFVTTFGYKNLFDAAFSDIPESKRYTRKTGALAIAAYNRTLLSNQAPWQDYLKGNNDALTDQEKRGAVVFLGDGKCVDCHTGPALKDKGFYAWGFGEFNNDQDAIIKPGITIADVALGRGGFTGVADDRHKFKTPTLYNLIDNGFYGHGSTFTSVRDVVEYKNNGDPQNNFVTLGNLAPQFGTMHLTEGQITDLVAFLEQGLRDPDLARYVPTETPSGFCFPVNDPQGRVDIGCE